MEINVISIILQKMIHEKNRSANVITHTRTHTARDLRKRAISQQAHNLKNNVDATSHRRWYDVVLTSCVCCDEVCDKLTSIFSSVFSRLLL